MIDKWQSRFKNLLILFLLSASLSACVDIGLDTCFLQDLDPSTGAITINNTFTVNANGNYSTSTTPCGIQSCTVGTDPECVAQIPTAGTIPCSNINNQNAVAACNLSATVTAIYNPNCNMVTGTSCGTYACSTTPTDPNYYDNCQVQPSTSGQKFCQLGTAGCTTPASNCTVTVANTSASSYGAWLNTGIVVSSGQALNVNTTGTVYLANPTGMDNTGQIENNGLGHQVYVMANTWQWTYSDMWNGPGKTNPALIYPGDTININIGEPATVNTTSNCTIYAACGSCSNSSGQCANTGNTGQSCSGNSCGGTVLVSDPTANMWATWNGTGSAAPPPWNGNIATIQVVGSGGTLVAGNNPVCASAGGTYNNNNNACWNIRGEGLWGVVMPQPANPPPGAPTPNPSSISNAVKLWNNNYSSTSPQNTYFSFTAGAADPHCPNAPSATMTNASTGNGYLYFRIWDCDPATTCYCDNVGGYTVYVTHLALPACNGWYNQNFSSQGYGSLDVMVVPNNNNPNSPSPQNCNGNCSNVSGNGTITAQSSGTLWLRVRDGGGYGAYPSGNTSNGYYTDNSGSYTVKITGENQTGGFSCLISKISCLLKNTLFGNNANCPSPSCSGGTITAAGSGAVATMFQNLTCTGPTSQGGCSDYIKTLQAMLMLYIIFYAICFIFGLVEINQLDLVIRVVKIGVVVALISPNSWQFFSSTLFNLFINGSGDLINMMSGNFSDSNNPFVFADYTMQMMLFSGTAAIRLIALIFSSHFGIFFLIMILYGFFVYIGAILKAAVVYLMAIIAIGFLLGLAPIFIPCILFSMTRHIFDNWIKYLVKYTLEPVILLVGLAVLSDVLLATLDAIFNYAACWKCAVQLVMGVPVAGLPSLPLFCLEYPMLWGFDNFGGGPGVTSTILGQFSQVMLFIIIAKIIQAYGGLSSQITAILTSTMGGASSASGAAYGLMHGVSNGLKSALGLDEGGAARRAFKNFSDEMAKEMKSREPGKNRKQLQTDAAKLAKDLGKKAEDTYLGPQLQAAESAFKQDKGKAASEENFFSHISKLDLDTQEQRVQDRLEKQQEKQSTRAAAQAAQDQMEADGFGLSSLFGDQASQPARRPLGPGDKGYVAEMVSRFSGGKDSVPETRPELGSKDPQDKSLADQIREGRENLKKHDTHRIDDQGVFKREQTQAEKDQAAKADERTKLIAEIDKSDIGKSVSVRERAKLFGEIFRPGGQGNPAESDRPKIEPDRLELERPKVEPKAPEALDQNVEVDTPKTSPAERVLSDERAKLEAKPADPLASKGAHQDIEQPQGPEVPPDSVNREGIRDSRLKPPATDPDEP